MAPLVIYAHTSDPTDGGVSDQTTDFLGAGVEIRFGRSFTAEVAAGRKAQNCNALGKVRVNAWRLRGDQVDAEA